MIRSTRNAQRLVLQAGILLAIALASRAADAQVLTQAPSAYTITVDGIFTNAQEWSDIAPSVFNHGQNFTYTALDPGLDDLYLMYDELSSTTPFGPTDLAGPVQFVVGVLPGTGHRYAVYFNSAGIVCLRDGEPFDAAGVMEGAVSFGPSRNSATPHNQLELAVEFDCSDPSLNGSCTGIYRPAPSFWHANIPPAPIEAHCVNASGDSCDSASPVEVDCSTPGAFQVFGPDVSNACFSVRPGTGGVIDITSIMTIHASVVGNGSIKPGGSSPIAKGASRTYTVAPNTCTHIVDVLVDGVSVGPVSSYTFTNVTEDHSISASFAPNGPVTINASAGPHGSISPSGAVSATCTQTFTITPESDYRISDVLVDGVSAGRLPTYAFTNLSADHTISATFEPGPTGVFGPTLPTVVWLAPPMPNPMRTGADFRFGLPRAGKVSLTIHDIVGREVVTLFRGWLDPGEKVMHWNGQDALGNRVPNSIYFYRLQVDGKALSGTVATLR
jgi:hypothetical protein